MRLVDEGSYRITLANLYCEHSRRCSLLPKECSGISQNHALIFKYLCKCIWNSSKKNKGGERFSDIILYLILKLDIIPLI